MGIARYDGSSWSCVGGGFEADGYDTPGAFDLVVHDLDGPGPERPALFAGGYFHTAGGVPANNIARWDGQQWTPLGGGRGPVYALASFDGIGGPALYAGGRPPNRQPLHIDTIDRWDGVAWSPTGVFENQGQVNVVRSMIVVPTPSGPSLMASGHFHLVNGQPAGHLAIWDGEGWTPFGHGTNATVRHLAAGRFEGRDVIVAAGEFDHAWNDDGTWCSTESVGYWDGSRWNRMFVGLDNFVHDLALFDDGAGPALYAVGEFTGAGSITAGGLARWTADGWSPVTFEIEGIFYACTVFDDGSGPALYFSGANVWTYLHGQQYRGVFRWKDGHVTALGESDPRLGLVHDLAVYDDGDGPALYAGLVGDGVAGFDLVLKWNGQEWVSIGRAHYSGGAGRALALAVFDDGSGPALYVGGDFHSIDGLPVLNLARWDGTQWSPVGLGLGGDPLYSRVESLGTYDGRLLVSGSFDTAGGVPVRHLAAWDGTSWSEFGGGADSIARAYHVADDGTGPALYVGGCFEEIGGVQASTIAKWNGSAWEPVDGGLTSSGDCVYAIQGWDDGSGPSVFMGGYFSTAGGPDGIESYHMAKWGCRRGCTADFNIDGVVDLMDFLAFQRAYADDLPSADLAHPLGRLNLFDVLAFQTAFGNGC